MSDSIDMDSKEAWGRDQATERAAAPVMMETHVDEFVAYLRTKHRAPEGKTTLSDLRAGYWMPIGRVALRNKLLTVADVKRVLTAQLTHPNLPFGEVACLLGLLNPEQVYALLKEQRETVPSFHALLCELTGLSACELATEWERFFHEFEAAREKEVA